MKNYEVRFQASARVLVIGAESEEQAIDFARDELPLGKFSVVDASATAIAEKDLAAARRHADCVSEG